jgi:hypothetical protein
MRTMTPMATLLAGLLAACGASDRTEEIGVALPWRGELVSCQERSAIGQELQAILEIGGHDPCPLSVDASSLRASGSCKGITAGIVRPLGLGYWLPEPGAGTLVPIAYLISWVDLRRDALEAGSDQVRATLAIDDTNSSFIYRDSEIDELPAPDEPNPHSETDAAQFNLFNARQWARCQLEAPLWKDCSSDTARVVTFQRRSATDSQTNLEEACAGTLWNP